MKRLFAVGLISILGQVALLRELSVAFYGIELIYSLAIGMWLLWTAWGSMISRHKLQYSPAHVNFLFLSFAFVLPLDVAFIRAVRLLFQGVPGAYLPFHIQAAAMAISLLPIGLILGWLFQCAAKTYVSGSRSLASAYGIESLGGLAGGLCATLLLGLGFQNFTIALLCAIAAAGSSMFHIENAGIRWIRTSAAIILSSLILCVIKAPSLDRFMTSWTHPNLIETKDTPFSRVSIESLDGQISVFENDALAYETEGTDAEEFVHLAALQHPNPGSVLMLGGGVYGALREILKHTPLRIDYVELNQAFLNLAARHLSSEARQSLRVKKVKTIIADPRQFLEKAGNYDLILIDMPEPSSGQANRFYTREFFEQCSARLNNNGIVAFSIRSSENLWTPQLTSLMISIHQAIKSAFRDVMVLPGSTSVFIGAKGRLTRDYSILAERFNARRINARLVSASYIRYLFTNDRFFQIADKLASGTAPTNSDARPICYQYATMIWLSKFFPSINSWSIPIPESKTGRVVSLCIVLALCLTALYLLSRTRWKFRRALLMCLAGFIGMALETLLILQYQTKKGILFRDLGILLMAFMSGLAAGALLFGRISYDQAEKKPISRSIGIVILLGFAALSALVWLEIVVYGGIGLAATSVLLIAAGFAVSGIFAYAGFHEAEDQLKAIAPLYSADLIGGCIGSLATSLLLMPVAGLGTTALMMIPLALISILLL